MTTQATWEHLTVADLEAYKRARQLSWPDLARDLGITPSTLYNWKKGSAVPWPSMQQRIAQRIGLEAPTPATGPPPPDAPTTPAPDAHPNGQDAAPPRSPRAVSIAVTGQIVASALRAYPGKISAEEIPHIILKVRHALEGR